MYQILNNKPMLIYGDGEQTRAFSYIDDCLESIFNQTLEGLEVIAINDGSTDNTLRDKYPYEPNTYYSNYER